jgi:hypothetical protein
VDHADGFVADDPARLDRVLLAPDVDVVPQIVVSVTLTIASLGPQAGIGRSPSTIRSCPSNTAARIGSVASPSDCPAAACAKAWPASICGSPRSRIVRSG